MYLGSYISERIRPGEGMWGGDRIGKGGEAAVSRSLPTNVYGGGLGSRTSPRQPALTVDGHLPALSRFLDNVAQFSLTPSPSRGWPQIRSHCVLRILSLPRTLTGNFECSSVGLIQTLNNCRVAPLLRTVPIHLSLGNGRVAHLRVGTPKRPEMRRQAAQFAYAISSNVASGVIGRNFYVCAN